MRKIIHFCIVFALIAMSSALQAQDTKAKDLLDQLSKRTATYTSMHADFEYTMKNKAEGVDEKQSGSLITQRDQYHLEIAGQKIISDGKNIWTVLEEAEEVQINVVPEDEESEDYISPTSILTLWEKGFNYKYDQALTMNGKAVEVVNLFPENPKDKSFHTIKLYIDAAKSVVNQIVIKGKDGTDFTYLIQSFKTNENIEPSLFKFLKKDHPDYDFIDLR